MMDSTLGISGDLWGWGYTMETPMVRTGKIAMSNMASLENPRTGAEFAGNTQKKRADLPAMFDDTGGYQDVHQQNNPQLPAESLPPTPSEEPLGKVQTVHPCSKPKLKKTNLAEEKHAKQKTWENASVDLRINHVIIPKKLN